jgi:hypothetical protein
VRAASPRRIVERSVLIRPTRSREDADRGVDAHTDVEREVERQEVDSRVASDRTLEVGDVGDRVEAGVRIDPERAEVPIDPEELDLVLDVEARRELSDAVLGHGVPEEVERSAAVEVELEHAARDEVGEIRGVEAIEERGLVERCAREERDAERVIPAGQRRPVTREALGAKEVVIGPEETAREVDAEVEQRARPRQRGAVAPVEDEV